MRERTIDGETTREVSFGITSLTREQADAACLLQLSRGHWGIENRLHYVRDMAFDEDRCRIRSGSAPNIMAAVRNATIGCLRSLGIENITAALRENALRLDILFARLGIQNN